jgi:exopolysaccharide production protein ExoZ
MQIEGRTAVNPILPSQLDWGMMGVDLFFVISGFIMVYITRDWREGGGRKVPEFLFARITRIYPLYWVVSGALLAVWFVRPDLVFSSSRNTPELLNSLFLIPAHAYPLLEVGWTLVYEMIHPLCRGPIPTRPRTAHRPINLGRTGHRRQPDGRAILGFNPVSPV